MTTYTTEDRDRRLEKFCENPAICQENKEAVREFISYLRADSDISVTRQIKYISGFESMLAQFVESPLKASDKDEIRQVIARIMESDYSDWTKRDYKTAIKKFYNTLFEDEFDRPIRVKKILNADFMKLNSNPERATKIDPVEPEHVMTMVKEGQNPRDRLLPLLFFETGARINEIRHVQLEDIALKQKYVDMELQTLKNDKGPRTLTLTKCVRLLQQWLEYHPRQDDPDAYLLCTVGKNPGRQMAEGTIRKRLRVLAERANIDKSIHPHAWRHAAATYYGMNWSITRMMYWFGWKDPDMAKTYCHENEDRMRNAKLAEDGLNEETTTEDATNRKECGRCGETWPPDQKFCGHCSLALDKDTAQELKRVEEAGQTVVKAKMDGATDRWIEARAQEFAQGEGGRR